MHLPNHLIFQTRHPKEWGLVQCMVLFGKTIIILFCHHGNYYRPHRITGLDGPIVIHVLRGLMGFPVSVSIGFNHAMVYIYSMMSRKPSFTFTFACASRDSIIFSIQ